MICADAKCIVDHFDFLPRSSISISITFDIFKKFTVEELEPTLLSLCFKLCIVTIEDLRHDRVLNYEFFPYVF